MSGEDDVVGALDRLPAERARALFDSVGVGVLVADLPGRILEANPALLRMLGASADDVLGTSIVDWTYPEDRDETQWLLDALERGDIPAIDVEKRYVTRSGATLWVQVSASLIRDGAGAPLYRVATITDISQRVASEQRLSQSESLRRLAGNLARIAGWSIDADDRRVQWSQELFALLGSEAAEALPLEQGWSLYLPGDRERLAAAVEASLAEARPFDLEVRMDTLDGRRIWARIVGEAQCDEDGEVVRVIGAFQDVTDVVEARRVAADLSNRLEATFEAMTDALFVVDRDWRFRFLNSRAEELLRRTRGELVGRVVWDEFPEAVGGVLDEAYHRAVRTGETVVVDEYYYPPLETWFEVNAYPSDEGLAVYFRDVSRRRDADRELRRRGEELRRQAALLDAASDAINVRGLDHRITYWNASSETLYGYAADEAVGADVRELLYEDDASYETALRELLRHGEWTGEFTHHTRSGEQRTVDARWTLLRDVTGTPEAVLAVNTDITERRQLERQYLRAQRMESLGTLAGGMAHDLNNMLAPIMLASELLLADEDEPPRRRMLESVHGSAQRGADLVAQVLSFARGVDGRRQPLDVAALIEDVSGIIRETFPRQIGLEVHVAEGLPAVLGDSTQLHQVLLNLAVNARDVLDGGGVLQLSARTVDLDEHYIAQVPSAAFGPHIVVALEDDGPGMPPEVVERVFEPFFTTKPPGEGTGLGLSTALAIVESHGGFIQVYSEPRVGTTFRVYLPVAADAVTMDEPATQRTDELPAGAGEVVLLVDDEAAVREITRRTLEAHGYEVIEASDGAEAVSVFARHTGTVDVVLIDMMMPVMDGPAAIHALRRLDADVRVIGASGLNGNDRMARAADAGVRHFLAKPYTTATLLQTIDHILHPSG